MPRRKTISRNKAAEILGVSAQTISNLASKGVISMVTVKGGDKRVLYRFYEDEIRSQQSVSVEIVKLDADTAALLEEARRVNREAREALLTERDRLRETRGWHDWMQKVRPFVVSSVKAVACGGSTMREQQLRMVGLLMDGKGKTDICEELRLERRQFEWIYKQALRHMKNAAGLYGEIRNVRLRNDELEKDNDILRKKVEELSVALGLQESRRAKEKEVEENVLSTKFEDLCPSVRLRNCLNNANVFTLGDAIVHNIEFYREIRNMGRKSICELQDILNRFKLKLPENELLFPVLKR